ncbi:MAG TPA: hypothetical protein DCM38_05480, partial [Gammaproteobacteria bacterium]|nr:hypothetical protein [Gammaproteobacteria bacterium]
KRKQTETLRGADETANCRDAMLRVSNYQINIASIKIPENLCFSTYWFCWLGQHHPSQYFDKG